MKLFAFTLPTWVKPALLVLAAAFLFRCTVLDLGRVAGRSMQPTLHDGDRIVTNQLAYGWRLPFTNAWLTHWSQPKRGDIVVLTSPIDGKRLVKRIVAGPGDRLPDGLLPDPTVPPGYYFVRGDAADSLDSRAFGCLTEESILSKVVYIAHISAGK